MDEKPLNPLDLESVQSCVICPSLGRDHVPSSGRPGASLMIVGQSPGAREVEEGEPFVGASGGLLDMMLEAAEILRADTYICNSLKCRPPENRPAAPDELAACAEMWLYREIKAVQPKVILSLGKDAATTLKLYPKHWGHGSIVETKQRKYLVSYHPSYFLRRRDLDSFTELGIVLKDLLEES